MKMTHNHHKMQEKNEGKPNCYCGKDCFGCNAEKLSVTAGSEVEAKQYEYAMDKKLKHKDHKKDVEHVGHDMSKMSHMDHEMAMTDPQMAKAMEADMRRRFWISIILSIPIFLYSPVGINFFKLNLPTPIPVNWLLFVLTTPIVFWAGSIFITGTYYSLKNRKLNMSVLVSTGVLAAYLFSIVLTITGGEETFYEAAALLVTFVLFGHWMEMKSRRGTSESLRALFDLVPPQARVWRDGKEVVIPSAEIIAGDIVILKPGDKVPVDGEVVEGESLIDESLVTGESIPVVKKINDKVIGGSINQTGAIKFKAIKVGGDTVLAQIIKMVETAQNSKAPGQRIADKAAAWLVVLAIGSGLATFLGWYFIAGETLIIALTFAVSTIVIACPDALGLATPTAVAVGTGIGAKHNILIKDAATLENTSKLTAIVLDKTGTLTEGKPRVTEIVAAEGYDQSKVLEIAAIVETNSNHPISAALIKEAENKKVEFRNRKTEKFEAIGGYGVKAKIDGKIVLAGTERLMIDNKVDFGKMKAEISRLLSNGNTISILAVDGKIIGAVGIADEIKSTAKATVAKLQEMRIEVAMITGDHEEVAKKVANDLGINRYFAQVLPEDKAKYVKKLQEEGNFVAMVGDGINDAPALAQADIGIAIGAGTDVAIETANVVLMKSDPYDIVRAIILSKATVAKMKQNLFWAAIYNVLAIPVAAGVFYTSFGISLRPEISALLMSASSIIVAINAVLLKRIEPHLKT
ncbi:MAG: copper-translocating P-type ATPase [bacterium]|nr:copper-translocating P-type ATPase [bacterium]